MTNQKWIGFGKGTKNKKGEYIEMYFSPDDISTSSAEIKEGYEKVEVSDNVPPSSVPEAYLKLHLLSLRLVKPNETNLDGIFGILNTVAWTSAGPIDSNELKEFLNEKRSKGEYVKVYSVDKFPCLTDYVALNDVRIADASRVRLGAYLGPGTTIMHEGSVNFNGGTLGEAMVEGRIAQGVIVGDKSDIGGGASTLGTLSGGNEVIISIGESCLLGANSGLGIPLGDRCTIESGLYVTGSSKVQVIENGKVKETVKAMVLAHKSDLLFIRNSITGSIECRDNRNVNELNEDLHDNN